MGDRVDVTHAGNCVLNDKVTLCGFLLVPSFKLNLISISKLTNDSNLTVQFIDKQCEFQDSAGVILAGSDDLHSGLYQYKSARIRECLSLSSENNLVHIWHSN